MGECAAHYDAAVLPRTSRCDAMTSAFNAWYATRCRWPFSPAAAAPAPGQAGPAARGGGGPSRCPFERGVSRLGIDCGGVLTCNDTDTRGEADTHRGGSLGIKMQTNPPTEECLEAVRRLVQHFGRDQVYIISKCGLKTQQATIVWLSNYKFFEKTGLRPDHVVMCHNRCGIEGHGVDISLSPMPPPDSAKWGAQLAEAIGKDAAAVTAMFGQPQVAHPASPYRADGTGECGKGVICRTLRLTHFIDDRAECLHSVFFEGHLATLGYHTTPSVARLFHFGKDAVQKRIHPHSAQKDTDMQQLCAAELGAHSTKKQKTSAAEVVQQQDPAVLWEEMSVEQRELWERLSELRASAPSWKEKGKKPSPEVIASIKEHKEEVKTLEATFGDETNAAFKAYERAQKAALKAPKQAAAAGKK